MAVATRRPPSAEEERSAHEICALARRHLAGPPAEVRKNLPADWAERLPLEVDLPKFDPLRGGFQAGRWWLTLAQEQAELRYTPAAGMKANFRAWFELDFERIAGTWQISWRGVRFVSAHALGQHAAESR